MIWRLCWAVRQSASEPMPLYNTIGEEEKKVVMEVLDSGVLSGFAAQPNDDHLGGPVVRALEDSFCSTFGTRYAVAVNSATSALHAAVSAMKVGTRRRGDRSALHYDRERHGSAFHRRGADLRRYRRRGVLH